jgi:hypothetical protein
LPPKSKIGIPRIDDRIVINGYAFLKYVHIKLFGKALKNGKKKKSNCK